jgi:hypothetical protein
MHAVDVVAACKAAALTAYTQSRDLSLQRTVVLRKCMDALHFLRVLCCFQCSRAHWLWP